MKLLKLIMLLLLSASVFAQTGKRLEVLFLGDKGHHKPMERIPSLMAALGPKGINFTYTDDLVDLNPQILAKYDALMVFANWNEIDAAAEAACFPAGSRHLHFEQISRRIQPVNCRPDHQ